MQRFRKNRRDFLKSIGLAAAAPLLSGCAGHSSTPVVAENAAKRPNVVLVMTDDQGYGDLGCHGNETIQTPSLDSLHAQSVRLTNFHVGPTCAPTRAALMTGRYCNRTGVWHTVMGRSLLRKDEVTMADCFKASGYRTGIFGKWHLGDNYPFRPQDRGFDEVLVHGGGGVGQTPDYWGNDYFDDTYLRNGKPKKFKGYCTDIWFDGALEFIEANKRRPFFCYIPTNAPHGPLNVAEEYSKPYVEKGVEPKRAAFYGMITNIDDNMARLMRRLQELGLEHNTILIFMTDNGTAGGYQADKGAGLGKGSGHNAGMRGKKGSEYEGGHRVPCFVRWPAAKIGGARDVSRLTAHIDLLPTLIELCGLEKPASVKFDGQSLLPLLGDPDANWPGRTLITDSQRIEDPEKWRKSAVMTDRWRLIKGTELYDIKADPAQTKDLVKERPDIYARLRSAYDRWWADVSERFGEYCPIIIGSPHENPSRLTCHDWHSIAGVRQAQSNPGAVRQGVEASGFWAVEIAREGLYRFELRRWPVEADLSINAAKPGDKAINAVRAKLKIRDIERTTPIKPNDKAAVFTLNLKAGPAKLQTWLIDEDNTTRGAYYVYVSRL